MKNLTLRNTVKKGIKAAFVSLIVLSLMAFNFSSKSSDLPFGWFKAGSAPDSYEMVIEKGAGLDGNNAATIISVENEINGFGTLMQTCSVSDYLGKRVRMSGYMKTKDISGWAGFWLRVDQKGSDVPLAFDNMHDGKENRSITGTTDWQKYEIVLDVPENAIQMAYGALEVGTGQIWFDNITIKVVDNSVPVTGIETDSYADNSTVTAPVNLDFEQPAGVVSEMSRTGSDFTIKNNMDFPVSFYWIDFSGREIFYFNLNPGQETHQQTYIGHVWIAREKSDHKKLKEVKVDSQSQSWVIN